MDRSEQPSVLSFLSVMDGDFCRPVNTQSEPPLSWFKIQKHPGDMHAFLSLSQAADANTEVIFFSAANEDKKYCFPVEELCYV